MWDIAVTMNLSMVSSLDLNMEYNQCHVNTRYSQYIVCNRDGTWEFRNGEPVLKHGDEVAIFNCACSIPLEPLQTLEDFFHIEDHNIEWDMGKFKNVLDALKETNKV